MQYTASSDLLCRWTSHPRSAEAAMVFMPAISLKNDYFLVRGPDKPLQQSAHWACAVQASIFAL